MPVCGTIAVVSLAQIMTPEEQLHVPGKRRKACRSRTVLLLDLSSLLAGVGMRETVVACSI